MMKSVFDRMHLQWFAENDGVISDPEVPVEGSEEFEMVEVGDLNDPLPDEGDKGEEKITLTPEEFQSLKQQGDSATAIQRGIAELGATINKPNQGQQQVAPQQPGESYEDFKKRLNSELFGDNPAEVLEEYFNKKMGPILQQVSGLSANQQKDLMMVKDETKKYFRKYQGDIESFHDSLPPDQKSNPRSWQYAYDEVLKKKQNEIIDDEVQARFDEMWEKKMKETGGPVSGGSASNGQSVHRSPQVESGAGMGGYATQPAGKRSKKVRYTKDDIRQADMIGLNIEDYLLAKGRLD